MVTSTQVNRPHRLPLSNGVLRSLLEAAAGEPSPRWDIAEAAIAPCRIVHGATLFGQDAVHPFVYAVRRGLLKLLYLDEDGNEWIKSFVQRGSFSRASAHKERRERELLTLSPEQRYRVFAANHPDLEQRIAQKDLTRHLGLTPVGMNRIVRRVRRGAGINVQSAAPAR